MCRESIDARTEELLMLRKTKEYLIDNKSSLIDYGINMISNSDKRYRYALIEQLTDFKNSINNDFDLIIEYCDELDDDIYEDSRILLDNFDRIYCDFYTYLSSFIKNEEIDEWIIDNLTDAFGFLAKEHSTN